MSRRVARTLAVAALLAVAAASTATAANKQVDAGKVFNMLESYLKLPAAERSHFTMAYYMHIGPQPLTAPVWLLADGKRIPLPLRADGKVERLPTLAELDHGKLEVGIDESSKINVTIGVEPLMPPTADLDAHELSAAIAQAATGAKKAAGIMALAMPKLEAVAFVGSGSGEIEFADRHRAPLPVVKGQPTYNPTAQPNATRIRLAKPPLKLDID
jgi:hypothetical protein